MYVNKRNLLCKILRNPSIPDIPRARVADAKQTRPSPVLERVWLRETNRGRHSPPDPSIALDSAPVYNDAAVLARAIRIRVASNPLSLPVYMYEEGI